MKVDGILSVYFYNSYIAECVILYDVVCFTVFAQNDNSHAVFMP